MLSLVLGKQKQIYIIYIDNKIIRRVAFSGNPSKEMQWEFIK